MIRAIMIKEITSGSLKGMSFNDQLRIETLSQLRIMDLIGIELDAIGPNYKIISVSLWDDDLQDYITRKQAEFKLK